MRCLRDSLRGSLKVRTVAKAVPLGLKERNIKGMGSEHMKL